MDRLTSIDASFLTNESSTSHMHIGAVTIFEGPPPSYDDLLDHIESRLHLVPRYRQKLAFPPVETGRPFWIDDPQFNLGYHVRHSALPSPGGEDELRRMAARVFSQQLDRTKPLWELWLVEGLRKKRFALISKTHHALVDGVAGVDIATVLFDVKPVPEPIRAERRLDPQPGAVRREPRGAGRRGPRQGAGHGRSSASPRRSAPPAPPPSRSRTRPRASARSPGSSPIPRPTCPLNVPIGPHRRYAWVRGDLAEFKRIKSALGGTVNDVVLCAVAGSMRRWLRARGVRTEGLELRALVPVSIRAEDQSGQARQPDRRRPRSAPGLRRGPGAAAAHRPRGDGRDQVRRRRRSAPR